MLETKALHSYLLDQMKYIKLVCLGVVMSIFLVWAD